MKYLAIVFSLLVVGCMNKPIPLPPPDWPGPEPCDPVPCDPAPCDPVPCEEPEPEPCVKGDDPCEYGGAWKKLKCEWVCDDAPLFADPSDYVAAARVESIVFYRTHEWEGLFAYAMNLTWAGSRDLRDVVRRCPAWGSALLGYDDATFLEAADSGELLGQETNRFIRKFWLRDEPHNDRNKSGEYIVNKRCDPDHEQHAPEFCGRTNVRKDVFNEFTKRLLAYNGWANGLRATAQECRWDDMGAFDSIIGWCGRMNAWGYKTCP